MGALYLAVTGDRGLERMMVIKTVLPHLADAEYVARFRDEAKVVVKLSHGNLIPVFDAGLVGGELFLAMDFVEGRDLRAVWNRCAKKQVAFPIDVAVYIVKELCRGLAYAHSFPDLNLVHRDISPPNVLVSYTGEVKLTDFGLASSTLKLEKTAPGIIYGKVAYMSPEQARGEKLDGRSDMYATGIVLWELLTGRQLFPPGKDQPQDLLTRAKNPEVMRPSKRAPRVPAELDEICLKALAPAKDDRYADCDEMRMALQGWLAANAPTTDGTRMASFLQELFSDDILRERTERSEMISRVRTRALTLPPTDELRQMIEKSDKVDIAALGQGDGEAPVRKPGSVGRRASDKGIDGLDRRAQNDRRGDRPRSPADKGSGAIALAAKEQEAPELDVGSEVDGRYKITELIGEGGMGKVYLAEHVEIGKRVALKVLHPSYSRMPDLVERFRREARAASKIGHPNIVDVTDSGSTPDGSVYFVMEYLEGVELGSIIEREGALDVARALRITGQICRALAAAHREGIIHRDLKPENIFLITRGGEADVVKVLDFGIAKTTEAEAARERRLTSPGMAMGTPEYMAPEQAAGRPADARTDIYSLGAIMYEMVTGVPPYQGDNFMEILTKKATQDPPPPLTIRPELPTQVAELVIAAMSRNPDGRPQTMEALEYELNKCLSGRGVAVAQILGMTTDANVVATLNPGLSMRNLDDGIVRPQVGRAATHSGMTELWETRSGITRPGGSSSGTGSSPPGVLRPISEPVHFPRAATPVSGRQLAKEPSAPSAPMGEVIDVKKRGGMAVFGWLMLVLIIVGGIGAAAYVMFFKPPTKDVGTAAPGALVGSDASAPVVEPPPPGSADSSTAKQVEIDTPKPPPTSDHVDVGSNAGSAVEAVGSDVAPQVEDTPKNPKNPKVPPGHHPPPPPHHPVVTAAADKEDKDPKALMKSGAAAEAGGDWQGARAIYMKLEKLKGYDAIAEYRIAYDAFQSNDTTAAQTYAQKAAAKSGPQKIDAMFLYADALFKGGDFKRAKDVYTGLRGKVSGDKKATATKKIALCNQKLGLPERDGVTD
ncbi:MAG: protein kinase [Deltaproteobacteria bacterium]|nr:protein kinase [Deltaproteobacteria bacterium]